jgi:hypothetical protein
MVNSCMSNKDMRYRIYLSRNAKDILSFSFSFFFRNISSNKHSYYGDYKSPVGVYDIKGDKIGTGITKDALTFSSPRLVKFCPESWK